MLEEEYAIYRTRRNNESKEVKSQHMMNIPGRAYLAIELPTAVHSVHTRDPSLITLRRASTIQPPEQTRRPREAKRQARGRLHPGAARSPRMRLPARQQPPSRCLGAGANKASPSRAAPHPSRGGRQGGPAGPPLALPTAAGCRGEAARQRLLLREAAPAGSG